MSTRILFVLRGAATIAGIASCLVAPPAGADTIIDQWNSVNVPPPPPLKAVMIDKNTTALLMLDFNEQTCNMQRRPRCIASIPKVKMLLAAARTAGVPVVFSVGGGGKPADLPRDLAPSASEPVVSTSSREAILRKSSRTKASRRLSLSALQRTAQCSIRRVTRPCAG